MHAHLGLCIVGELTLYQTEILFFIPGNIPHSKIYFNINVASPAFFGCIWMVCFFHPFPYIENGFLAF